MTSKITFVDHEGIAAHEPDVVNYLRHHTAQIPHATATIYVSERDAKSQNLQWQAVIASPQGRQTYRITQRMANSPIIVSKD